ncbi:MAG: hypothetical protein CMM93_00610 [Rickettsiales bacterium]|nr:hypothetical protein [Rickettsiales bacterium]|tara:strand:- start:665 stop:1900 length:1236 start_codon:yes stop_codon:yes gene_type:complete
MVTRLLKRFLQDESGNVLIIVGFTIIILVAIAGASIDFGRSEIIGHKMHQAADAGALAGAAMPIGSTETERKETIKRYFRLNFPDDYMGSSVTAEDLVMNASPNWTDPDTINVQVENTINTGFITQVGQDTLNTASETEVGVQAASALDLDLVFVVDGSSSMQYPPDDTYVTPSNPSKTKFLKDALTRVNDTLLKPGNVGPNDKVRIGLVEFGQQDGTSNFVKRRLDLTDNYAQIRNFVTGIQVPVECGDLDSGEPECFQTPGGRGAEAGRDMILSAPPRPDGNVGAAKLVVFLTDGLFNRPTDPGFDWRNNENQRSWDLQQVAINQFTNACDDMKDENVVVYTTNYGFFRVGPDRNNELPPYMMEDLIDALQECASDPDSEYYRATLGGEDLIDFFDFIAVTAKKLRVSK